MAAPTPATIACCTSTLASSALRSSRAAAIHPSGSGGGGSAVFACRSVSGRYASVTQMPPHDVLCASTPPKRCQSGEASADSRSMTRSAAAIGRLGTGSDASTATCSRNFCIELTQDEPKLVAAASELRAVAVAGGLRAEDPARVSNRGSHEVLRLRVDAKRARFV